MSIKLDLSAFKHVKSDDKCTELLHKDGHTLRLAHGSLSKDNQAQLKALAGATKPKEQVKEESEQPQMMARGGSVLDEEQPPATDGFESMAETNRVMADPGMELQGGQPVSPESINTQAAMPGNPNYPDPVQTVDAVSAAPQEQGIAEQQAMASPEAQQPQMQQQQAPTQDLMQQGYKDALAGIDKAAEAKAMQAVQQSAALKADMEAKNTAMTEYKNNYATLERERMAHMQDIRDGHVDPDKYWDSHSKVATGIGIILAGFNPTNNPNAAINFLKHNMELNIQAQKENLGAKQNLLSANLRQFGNLKDAMDMTRIMQSDVLQNKLAIAAANAASPAAAAAALQAKGQLEMDAGQLFQKLSANKTVASLVNQAQQDPSKIPAAIQALEAVDPKRAAQMRGRFIPGVGLANTEEGAKGLREMGTTVKTVQDGVKRLKEIAKMSGKSMNPKAIAEADTIRSAMIGQLRVPVTGPGAMSDGERELLQRMIPDVTSMMSLDSSNKKRLDTLEQRITGQFRNQAQLNGINVPGVAKSADPKQAAAEWLSKNPNHPKAAEVKKRLGQ